MSGFYVQHVGIGKKDAASFLETSIKLLRLAHLIASGVSGGESSGRV